MKKDKLIQEFNDLKIENAKDVLGGSCNHPTLVQDFPTSVPTNQNCNGVTITIWDSDTQNQTWDDPDSIPDTIRYEKPLC